MVQVIAVPRRGYDEDATALPALSSSLVRSRLAEGGPVTGMVPPAVAALIAAHGWYRAVDGGATPPGPFATASDGTAGLPSSS